MAMQNQTWWISGLGAAPESFDIKNVLSTNEITSRKLLEQKLVAKS